MDAPGPAPRDAPATAIARGALPDPGNRRPVRHGWSKAIDVVTWPVSWLLDRNDRLSTSKVMAFAILAAFWREHKLPVTVVAMLLAASFGYTAWKDFVAKGSWGVQATDNVALSLKHDVTEHVEHTITEVRGPAGEPMHSLPPVPGAKTPSGEE